LSGNGLLVRRYRRRKNKVVNYMGENVQPGVKAVAKAITQGIIEAQKEEQQKP